MDVSVIIVNFNTWRYLKPCIESIENYFSNVSHEIIVADNNSADGSVKLLKEHFPLVTIIENTGNLGFAKANNQAAAIARGDFLFLLNADTLIRDDRIQAALDFMKQNNVALLGPMLLNPDNSLQRSYQRRNSLNQQLLNILLLTTRLSKFVRRDEGIPGKPAKVGFLVGAALLIDANAVRKNGLFDEQFFFTGEERDLCLRLLQNRLDIYYYPAWTVMHYGGSGDAHNPFHILNWIKSTIQLTRKHGTVLHTSIARSLFFLLLLSNMVSFYLKSLLRADSAFFQNSIRYKNLFCWYIGRFSEQTVYSRDRGQTD